MTKTVQYLYILHANYVWHNFFHATNELSCRTVQFHTLTNADNLCILQSQNAVSRLIYSDTKGQNPHIQSDQKLSRSYMYIILGHSWSNGFHCINSDDLRIIAKDESSAPAGFPLLDIYAHRDATFTPFY